MLLVVKLHAWLFQLAAWLLGQLGRLAVWLFISVPIAAVTKFATTVLAWVHIMVKLWLGVIAGGIICLVAASALIKASPPGSNWRLVALLVCLLWLLALFGAARFTMEYLSLRRVRQNQAFGEVRKGVKEVRGEVRAVRKEIVSNAARKTRGTPIEGAFSANRSARAEEQAAAARAAERAEVERERERQDRASDRERVLELERLGPDHDPFGGR
jgi:hypothetical protein